MIARPVILCIDDEPDLLQELVEELGAMGFDAYGAINAAEAKEAIDRLHPDLIVSDILMPGGSGFDVLALMRSTPELEAIPFIFLTALTDRDHQILGRKAGADDYLVKPVDIDLLEAAIRTKLDFVARLRHSADPPTAPPERIHLSRRETQVLTQLGLGLKVAEIAQALEISEHTVNQYVKAVYAKLDISNRAEAAREAIRRGLLN